MCKKLEMFKDNLLETNRGFNFYVDWSNVTGLSKYDIESIRNIFLGDWLCTPK